MYSTCTVHVQYMYMLATRTVVAEYYFPNTMQFGTYLLLVCKQAFENSCTESKALFAMGGHPSLSHVHYAKRSWSMGRGEGGEMAGYSYICMFF